MRKYHVVLFSIACFILSKCKYSLFVTSNLAYILYIVALFVLIKKFKYEKYIFLVVLLFNVHSLVSIILTGLRYSMILYVGTRVVLMRMLFEFLILYPLMMIHKENKPLELTDTYTEVE